MRNRTLALMGEISAVFSNLEFMMLTLLAKLIDTSAGSSVGSFLVDDFTLARTVELVRRFSRYRFVHMDDMVHRIADLCNSVDQVRVQRNLFVHGMWILSPELLAQGKVHVLDMRWKEDREFKQWSRAKEHVFTEQDLVNMRDRIGELIRVASAIDGDAVASKMMPHWQRTQVDEQPPPADPGGRAHPSSGPVEE